MKSALATGAAALSVGAFLTWLALSDPRGPWKRSSRPVA